jgi:hypothetical protein
MTPREKVLTYGVGGILLLAGCQYIWMQYRSAVDSRQTRAAALDQQIFDAREKLLQGAYADRMFGEYLVRSLPSDPERARADYARWLYEIIGLVDLRDASVKFVNTMPGGELYQLHSFRVSGKTDQRGWLELMHLFYSKDHLHRISDLQVRPHREGGLAIDMRVDVLGLTAAQPELPSPEAPSPLVDSYVAYEEPILNRNFFSPPNQPPRFTSPSALTVNVGESANLSLQAEDPENDGLRYALVGEPPEGLELDPRSGSIRWRPEAQGAHQLVVRVSDDGYPIQSTEQRFEIAVVDPPPPPRTEPAGFDDSTQTVLTALVQGGGDWTAWMNVRTQGTTLKLRPGDTFEIGRLSGTVVEVNARFVTLEIDGKRFELRPAGNLAEAARSAVE